VRVCINIIVYTVYDVKNTWREGCGECHVKW